MSNRLGNDNYKRPKQTLQDKLTKDEINEKLIGYKELDDIDDLKNMLGNDIRYFIFENTGTQKTPKVIKKFRLGGKLIKVDSNLQYIVLATGLPPNQKTWSVQLKDSQIFYKMKVEDVIEHQSEQMNDIKEKYEKEINLLKQELLKIKDEKTKVITMYNELVDKYQKLKSKK